MESFLNTAIHVGPSVFLLGLLIATACIALQLFRPGRLRVLRCALVTAALGGAAFIIGTGLGIAAFCSTTRAGNLCGLGGVFGTGPFAAGLCIGCYSIFTLRAFRNAR
jgi:hypothetical protein